MKSPSSILFVDQYAEMGGGQVVLLELIEAALNAQYRVALLAPGGGKLEKAVQSRFGKKIEWRPLPTAAPVHGFRAGIRHALRSLFTPEWTQQPVTEDIVHINGLKMALPALFHLDRSKQTRVFLHLHLAYSKLAQIWIMVLCLHPRFARCIAISSFVQESLILPLRRRSVVIENWLPVSFPITPAKESRPKVAVTVGRLLPQKGQSTVVQVARKLPSWTFIFIGSDHLGDARYARALQEQAPANCHFLGEQAHPWQEALKYGAKIGIIPSEWEEPFGLVAIESVAAGLLTFVRPRGGLKELAARFGLPTFETAQDLEQLLLQSDNQHPPSNAQAALQITQQNSIAAIQSIWAGTH